MPALRLKGCMLESALRFFAGNGDGWRLQIGGDILECVGWAATDGDETHKDWCAGIGGEGGLWGLGGLG